MKKNLWIIIAALAAVALAVFISVATMLDKDYLEPLSYDHIDDTVYGGVEIIGKDGLLYLVKDEKVLSEGYTYLKSVNDWYSPSLYELVLRGEDIKLFDYYIAKAPDRQNYLLVNAFGEEYTIMGDSYSLSGVTLPYVFFVNNVTGRMAALSLNRLDSDLSYKSGSELTLRPFKAMTPMKSYEEDVLCSYIITDDVAEEPTSSYFDGSGIKIASGRSVEMFYLNDENKKSVLFYDTATAKIHRLGSAEVVNNVYYLYRSEYTNWRYAVCTPPDSDTQTVVILTAGGSFALPKNEYVISSLWGHENCLIGKRSDGNGYDVINVNSGKKETYGYIRAADTVLVAISKSGFFHYLNGNGVSLLQSSYGDMLVNSELSVAGSTVFSSESYDTDKGGEYLHFTGEGVEAYTLSVSDTQVSVLRDQTDALSEGLTAYILSETSGNTTKYRVFTPISANRLSEYYDSVKLFTHGEVAWILALDKARMVYEIVDPFNSRAVGSVRCTEEEFAKYAFTHYDNIALATSKSNTSSTIPIAVIRLSKYENDDLISRTIYFALYRTASKSSTTYAASSLKMTELGKDLLIGDAYDVYTARNCLVTHSTSGSVVFSIEESRELSIVAEIPYSVTDILTDRADGQRVYFEVTNGDGKLGIYDKGAKELLPPYYEDVLSVSDGEFIVRIRGALGIVKSDGAGVVDPLYSEIVSMGENGYIAWDGDRHAVIIEDGVIIHNDAVQSVNTALSFTFNDDEELSVSLWTTVSIGGKLLIHRSSAPAEEINNSYVPDKVDDSVTELNDRAKVVYYYDGNVLCHTEVIHPQQTSFSLIDSPNGKGWYATTAISTQTIPVTEEYVISYDGHIIRLYSKR